MATPIPRETQHKHIKTVLYGPCAIAEHPFAYTTAKTPSAFQWGKQPPKLPILTLADTRYLGPPKSAPNGI